MRLLGKQTRIITDSMAEQSAEHNPLTTFNVSEVLLDMLLFGLYNLREMWKIL